MQNTLRDTLRTQWWAYRLARPFWLAFKAARRMFAGGVKGAPAEFYVGGGSWYGNQTIWRMIYDLNLIAQCVDANGDPWMVGLETGVITHFDPDSETFDPYPTPNGSLRGMMIDRNGDLWAADGRLIAQSRQLALALYPRPKG